MELVSLSVLQPNELVRDFQLQCRIEETEAPRRLSTQCRVPPVSTPNLSLFPLQQLSLTEMPLAKVILGEREAFRS